MDSKQYDSVAATLRFTSCHTLRRALLPNNTIVDPRVHRARHVLATLHCSRRLRNLTTWPQTSAGIGATPDSRMSHPARECTLARSTTEISRKSHDLSISYMVPSVCHIICQWALMVLGLRSGAFLSVTCPESFSFEQEAQTCRHPSDLLL